MEQQNYLEYFNEHGIFLHRIPINEGDRVTALPREAVWVRLTVRIIND